MNVNIPQLADTLFERTANTSWVVVFKSLTATHHLMVYGNEVSARHWSHFIDRRFRRCKRSLALLIFQPLFGFPEIYPVFGVKEHAVQPQ